MSDTQKSVTREEFVEAMFTARYPEGFWVEGHSAPPERSDDEVADILLAKFAILDLEPDGTWDCSVEGPDGCTIPDKGRCTARCVGDEQ